jgi:hypothetical protein
MPSHYESYLASLKIVEATRQISIIRLLSDANSATEVWLEPWGDLVILEPGSHCDIVEVSRTSNLTGGNVLTVERCGASLVVYASTGMIDFAVFKNGSSVWSG